MTKRCLMLKVLLWLMGRHSEQKLSCTFAVRRFSADLST